MLLVAALRAAVCAARHGWEAAEVVLAALSGAGQGRSPGGVPALWWLAGAWRPHQAGTLRCAGGQAVTLTELLGQLGRRAAEAEREGATAPVANVYRVVLDELRAVNGAAAAPPVMPDAPAEERYLTSEQLEEMLALPKGY